MNRKIIFAIVVLAAITLSLIENRMGDNGVIARQEDVLPTSMYGPMIRAEETADSTLLMWEDAGEDIQYYTVYRKLFGEKDWQPLHRIEASAEPGYKYRFRDTSAAPELWYYLYNVVATTSRGDLECMVMYKPVRTQ